MMTRRNKYNAVRTEYKGRNYDSKAEAAYAHGLDVLLMAGQLRYVSPQPVFYLAGNSYRANFLVEDNDGKLVVVDVKGMDTAAFKRIKKNWQAVGPSMPLVVIGRNRDGSFYERERVQRFASIEDQAQ